MINFTPLLKIYAKKRNTFLSKINYPLIQEKQLFNLLKKGKKTKFGKDHSFASMKTIEDYQRNVPLRTYEDFWNDYIKEYFPVLKNILWPGTISYYAVSSGTTSGNTKYIPYTREMTASNRQAALDLLVFHINNKPDSSILKGKSFMLGGSTEMEELAPGIYGGDLSGIAVKEMPRWIRPFYFPNQKLALLKNWEEKIDILAHKSLENNIRMISGVPSWLIIFFEKLREIKNDETISIQNYFPHLEMLIHGGVNFKPYIKQFQTFLGALQTDLREVYPASEGFIAIADRKYDEGLRLMVDNMIFYEFVPLEELHSDNPTRHYIGTVEKNVNYAIILTTCAGLYSYIIGDTVMFTDLNPPRIKITGRTSFMLSAFGEHVIVDEIEDAISAACDTCDIQLTDYSVGAIIPETSNELGKHIIIMEPVKQITNSETLDSFKLAFDKKLCERNDDYKAHRAEGYGLDLPEILVAEEGTFKQWMKKRGKLGGQNKVPRIINDPELLQDLLAFAKK